MKLAKAVLVLDGKAEYLLSDVSSEGLTASGRVINGGWHLTISGRTFEIRNQEAGPLVCWWNIKPHVDIKLIDVSELTGDFYRVMSNVQDVLNREKEHPSTPTIYGLDTRYLEEA